MTRYDGIDDRGTPYTGQSTATPTEVFYQRYAMKDRKLVIYADCDHQRLYPLGGFDRRGERDEHTIPDENVQVVPLTVNDQQVGIALAAGPDDEGWVTIRGVTPGAGPHIPNEWVSTINLRWPN